MRVSTICLAVSALAAVPANAEVVASSDSGFVSHNEAEVPVLPSQAWYVMTDPSRWWNGDHTYSGDAASLTLDPIAGGCFCEAVLDPGDGPTGHVEHMRVVYAAPYTTLRLNGGLGPLQSEAVTGVLTMTLEPSGGGTRITWDYVVGGYSRMPLKELAPVVDRVVGEQLSGLAAALAKP